MKFLFAIVLLVLVAAVMCDTDLLTADQKLTTLSPAEIEAQQWTAFKVTKNILLTVN